MSRERGPWGLFNEFLFPWQSMQDWEDWRFRPENVVPFRWGHVARVLPGDVARVLSDQSQNGDREETLRQMKCFMVSWKCRGTKNITGTLILLSKKELSNMETLMEVNEGRGTAAWRLLWILSQSVYLNMCVHKVYRTMCVHKHRQWCACAGVC